jgi:putative phage-type endonuclease
LITKVKTASHEEWLKLRSQYIGGSDAAAVVGMNPFASPYSLWAEKTGKVPGFAGNLATEVGTYLEEFVAQKFAQETGKKVRKCNQSFLNSEYPFAIANIDRDIVGEDAGLECKSTSVLNTRKFKNGDFPENYYCQCVHYLGVTKKKRWYIAVLIGNSDFKIYMMTRVRGDKCPEWCESSVYIEDAEIAALMGAEADFWELVKKNTPPAVDGIKATSKALNAVYADSTDAVVDLSGFGAHMRKYMALKEQIKDLETQADEIANRVKKFLGEAGRGECTEYKVSWKSQTKRTFDAKRFAKENPDIDLSSYYNTSSTRVFRVTESKGV